MTYIPLSLFDLAAAAALILINGFLSWRFRLGLERSLALATFRIVAQLAVVGFLLKFVFAQSSALLTAALAIVMILVASYEVAVQQGHRLWGWAAYGLAAGTLFLVSLIASVYAMTWIIRPEPWHDPRYLLPILGIVLGNALTGVALVLNSITEAAKRERPAIEARLALGAGRFEAMGGVLGRGLKSGLMPIVNGMAAAGIVALPGVMTGQILAGVDPIDAAKYQIMIVFLISGTTALAAVVAALGGLRLLTDARHRLRLDRLGLPS
jgi:putative ABC transport system permease protein